MSLHTHLPLFLYRLRNLCVDLYAWYRSRRMPPRRFPEGYTERGQPIIPETFGPDYPQCLRDLDRLYRENRYRITRKLIGKIGRVRKSEFRGLVSFEHKECIPLCTLEFSFPRAFVFVVFQDLEYVERPIRVVVQGQLSTFDFYDLICDLADRLEYALLPKDVRVRDGGRSLQK